MYANLVCLITGAVSMVLSFIPGISAKRVRVYGRKLTEPFRYYIFRQPNSFRFLSEFVQDTRECGGRIFMARANARSSASY